MKASSESGLCAIDISRVEEVVLARAGVVVGMRVLAIVDLRLLIVGGKLTERLTYTQTAFSIKNQQSSIVNGGSAFDLWHLARVINLGRPHELGARSVRQPAHAPVEGTGDRQDGDDGDQECVIKGAHVSLG